jgi:hypothetical protein
MGIKLANAFFIQLIALSFTLLGAYASPLLHNPLIFLVTQTTLAVIGSYLRRQPSWWMLIHFLFLPSVFIFFWFEVPSWTYLLTVSLLVLVFWGTVRGDVPLFLSSHDVAQTVITLLEKEQAQTFADLGAGIGSVAIPIASHLKTVRVDAWEHAPLPWLISHWRGRYFPNYKALRRNFFTDHFAQYDVVFAFLSPAVMPNISKKIKREMRKGTLFISSSFPAPHWKPEIIIQLEDRRKTQLYCYRIK